MATDYFSSKLLIPKIYIRQSDLQSGAIDK